MLRNMEPLCEGDHLRVFVDGAVQASITLGAVVQPSFGPNGLDILLEGSDGHVSCCNCGCQILASLSLSHPVGSLIKKSVTDYHQLTGDGTKKMLLTLRGALEELSLSLDHTQLQHSKIEVSQAIEWLNHTIIPSLSARLRDEKLLCRTIQAPEELHSIVTQVTSTTYRHRYGGKISKKLEEILSAVLFPSHSTYDIHSLRKHVQFTRKNMSSLVVSLPGHPVSHSHTIPGFVLDRDLVHLAMEGWEWKGLGSLQTVFVLDWDDDLSSQPQLSAGLLGGLDGLVGAFSQHAAGSVATLQAIDVQLVLCSGKVPAMVRQLLGEAGIMVIEMVAEDVLKVMAECCATYPLHSLRDLRNPGTTTISLTVSPLSLESKQYLCLQLPPGIEICPVSVVLCAPTLGFCRQLQQQLSNTLQATQALCQEDSDYPAAAVAGGGAWEMAMIRQLETCIQEQKITKHSSKWTAIKALQKGLMAIPQSLLTSSLPADTPASRNSRLALYANSINSDLPHMAIDCLNGSLIEISKDWCVWEAYTSQCQLLNSVLSLITQLLRLDHIVSAKRL